MLTDAIIAEGLRLDAERTQEKLFASVDCSDGKGMDVDIISPSADVIFTAHTNNKADSYSFDQYSQWQEWKDAAYLAHAANNYAAICRRVRELEAENERLRQAGREFVAATTWIQCRCDEYGCQYCDKIAAARRRWQEVDLR